MPDTSELLRFLQHSGTLLEETVESAAKHWQISSSEAKILVFLTLFPHLDTASDAAANCGMSKASVSGNVLKLTTRGLLTVDMDLKDRRFQHLALTAEAAPIVTFIHSKLDALCHSLLLPLSEDEVSTLLGMLYRINHSQDNFC